MNNNKKKKNNKKEKKEKEQNKKKEQEEDQNKEEQILYKKEGFIFSKVQNHHYKTTFSMENKNIHLASVINFDLIKLIYELNNDVYEKVHLEKSSDSEAIAILLIKHFFADLGLPQKYSYLHIKKYIDENNVVFRCSSIHSEKPEGIPIDAELMAINLMESVCALENPHKINFTHNIYFDNGMYIPPFVEKMVGIIVNKIFKRVKQFIENL